MVHAPKENREMNLLLKKISLPLTDFPLTIDVEIQNQVTAIFGPSGAGKTSLLDLIAGLRRPKSAFIQLNERVLTDTATGTNVPTRHRQIGYVPQDLALFPHLSVQQNLVYGSKEKRNADSLFSYQHVTDILEIGALTSRRVTNLSGGEKQRVALARALLASPQILLLDEPLASLDTILKSKIIPYLARIRDAFQIPMLYVTHDWDEVQSLCAEALIMERGEIVRRERIQKMTAAIQTP
jgi:molybdate transport system ATP-binding protein